MMNRPLPCLAILAALLPAASHAEVCRFTGTTSHDGHLQARVETTEAGGLTTIDATVSFAVSTWMSDFRYLGQEISTWRGGVLQSVAVNQRTLADDSVKRQQWDVFTRASDRLEGHRVQATRLIDFQQRYPSFVQHWAPTSFGQPWLADYHLAAAERRPDLDLPAAGAITRTPLAFAFYWSRFLPPEGEAATMVLPGFKHDVSTKLQVGPAVAGDGWRRWSTPLHHPGLESSPASLAAAWVSPQNYLLQLGFDVHTTWVSGQAILRPDGCQGIQIRPE